MSQITVYQTDVDGLYVHEAVANETPLQPGTFMVPYGAKLTPPPSIPDGHAALASGDNWTIVEDHRSEKFYRTDTATDYSLRDTVMVNDTPSRYLGWGPIPEWLTNTAPPAPGSTWENGAWVPPETSEQSA